MDGRPSHWSPPDPVDAAGLAIVRARILDRIARACDAVARDPAGLTLVAVSKLVSASRIRAAVAAGFEIFGENRVQEAAAKVADVAGARWALVGPLQSNKARLAVETFDAIQTVNSLDLARRLDRVAGERRTAPLPVLIQVNVDEDPAKAGLLPEAAAAALPELAELEHLRLDGLMTIGRLADDPEAARGTFRALRVLSESLRSRHAGLGDALSMGMSDDFPVAIEEGATIVRIGRAIFGARPEAGG